MPIRLKLTFPLIVLTLFLTTAQFACTGRKPAPVEASTAETAKSLRHATTASGSSHNGPQHCPAFGTFPEPPLAQVKGEHTVILSWNASAVDAKHASPIGYCIYRGVKNDDKTLVRLNSLSFPGTSCTDDMVQTGQTYFYKVKAIGANEKTSSPTDFAPAAILDRKVTNPVATPPSLCRDASQYPAAVDGNTGQHQ